LAALTFPETVRIKAELTNKLVGFVFGDRRRGRDVGWIASIGVDPGFRRRGIGEALLERCEHDLDTSRIRLALRPSNHGAKQLYLKAGYSERDRWKRYYRNGEDAVVMEKSR
jgi:ribosomal-protein-alanine N-acetyltransferase